MLRIIISSCIAIVCNGYTYPPKLTTELMLTIRENIVGKIYNMSCDIMKDVDIKYRLVQRYIDMHRGTWDFEVGLIAGTLFDHFREMLRTYKHYSNRAKLQYYDKDGYYVFSRQDHYDYLYMFQLVHGEYNEIVYNKRAFFALYDKHQEMKKKYSGSKVKQAFRRHYPRLNEITASTISTAPGDYYVDYFGHKVFKNEVKKSIPVEDTDHFEDYFEEHVDKLIKKYTNKTEIEMPRKRNMNQAYELISKTGIEHSERDIELHMGEKERVKSKKIIEELEKLYGNKRVDDREFKRTLGEAERVIPHKITEEMEKLSHKDIDDSEYKKMLRLKSYEKQRAKFNPELEGIEIDLKEMV